MSRRKKGLARARNKVQLHWTPCHYCKWRRADTVDHIVPKAIGGPDHTWNLAPACRTCNETKADRGTCTTAFLRAASKFWERAS